MEAINDAKSKTAIPLDGDLSEIPEPTFKSNFDDDSSHDEDDSDEMDKEDTDDDND